MSPLRCGVKIHHPYGSGNFPMEVGLSWRDAPGVIELINNVGTTAFWTLALEGIGLIMVGSALSWAIVVGGIWGNEEAVCWVVQSNAWLDSTGASREEDRVSSLFSFDCFGSVSFTSGKVAPMDPWRVPLNSILGVGMVWNSAKAFDNSSSWGSTRIRGVIGQWFRCDRPSPWCH